MKRFILLFFCLICVTYSFAQSDEFKPLSANEQSSLLNEVMQAIETLQCDFVQEKSSTMLADVSVQRGQLFYRTPYQLRWAYSSPNSLVFIYNNGQSATYDSRGALIKQNNRMFQELSQLIIGLISGNSLRDAKQFKVASYSNNKWYKVVLQPTNSRLKSLMVNIELLVDCQTHVASQVKLNELGGDCTTIRFLHPQLNRSLSDSLFKIK